MKTELYRELFELLVAGAVAGSTAHTDAILAKPALIIRELVNALPPAEADKLIDAIEAVNKENDRRRAERNACEGLTERELEALR